MANNDLSLQVYEPITGTGKFIEDIADVAQNYSHTIRLLGGFWTASFRLSVDDIGDALYEQWRTNRFFYHFVEQWKGQTTWEGSLEGFQVDDDTGLIDVTAYGYVHSIQNKYQATTDLHPLGTTDANVFINHMLTNDCEFVQAGNITANTLQIYEDQDEKTWTCMLTVAEIADTSVPAAPYACGVYQNRRLNYGPVSSTPIGYVRGGVRWRIDGPNDLINYVIVRYTDETGTDQPDVVGYNQDSINRFGRRETRLSRSRIPTASADALANAYAFAHMWPFMRAIGCSRDIQVYNTIGSNTALSPWLVQPGVYQDTTLIGAPGYYLAWMPAGAFLADEVIASASGVQLRTGKWDESDALDAYYQYQSRNKDRGNRGKGNPHKRRNMGGSSGSGGSGGGGSGGSGGSRGTGSTSGTGGGAGKAPPTKLPT